MTMKKSAQDVLAYASFSQAQKEVSGLGQSRIHEKQYFLGLEKGLGGSRDPAYPSGPFFNPLGFGKDEKYLKDLKLKEVKNERLAKLAIMGYFVQGSVIGVGPFQNLLDHSADPVNNIVLTSLKFH